MRVLENTKAEIEKKLVSMGDYVRMDYLSSCLKQNIPSDAKKFCMVTLAGIYESRGMLNDSAKLFRSSAELAPTEKGRKTDFLRACELFIKAGNFADADSTYQKILVSAVDSEKKTVKNIVKGYYLDYARTSATKTKRRQAAQALEKVYREFELSEPERKQIKEELAGLYDNLGRVKEYFSLKRS